MRDVQRREDQGAKSTAGGGAPAGVAGAGKSDVGGKGTGSEDQAAQRRGPGRRPQGTGASSHGQQEPSATAGAWETDDELMDAFGMGDGAQADPSPGGSAKADPAQPATAKTNAAQPAGAAKPNAAKPGGSAGAAHADPAHGAGAGHADPAHGAGAAHADPAHGAGAAHADPAHGAGAANADPAHAAGAAHADPAHGAGAATAHADPAPPAGAAHAHPAQPAGAAPGAGSNPAAPTGGADGIPTTPVGGGDTGGGDAGGGDAGGGDVQARAESPSGLSGSTGGIQRAAQQGIAGSAGPLPHRDAIQHSFGHHDVGGVQAHTDGAAAGANQAMGAEAYATGDHVAFASGSPSLHTVAHEAAHVVQQRGGVQLKGGVGEVGDIYEQHADAVADRVVRGESAQSLLDQHAGGSSGAAAVQHQIVQLRGPNRQAISLDELRHAIDEGNAANAIVGFRGLSAADKRTLTGDQALITRLLAVVTPEDGLTVLRDLRLPRLRALGAAAGARNDAAWLTSVLRQLHLDRLPSLGAAANDLSANPAYLVPAVLDPIVNASGVTAQQQATFATTTNGETILRAAWGNQSPLLVLHALALDKTVVRNSFARNRRFASWLLESEQVLLDLITTATDGAAWARAMWGGTHEPVLIRWINANPQFWGTAIGEALLHPQAGDAAKLRASAALSTAVFSAIGTVQGVAGLAAVLDALHYTLAEKIKAVDAAHLLTAESINALLNGPRTTAAQQATMTQDDAVIALIRTISGGALPNQVLTILARDTDAFCTAVTRNNAFTHWVIDDAAALVRIIAAVVNYPKWIDVFRRLNKGELLLTCAADTGIQPNFRAAIIARSAFHWLVSSVPHPLTDDAQSNALLAIFGDGNAIALADKILTWQCVFTTPLKKHGEDLALSGAMSGGATWNRTYYAVNPNNDAMNLFFHQYRQMPRTHVNTAAAIMMCEKYQLKVTQASGAVSYWNTNSGSVQVAAPGHVPLDTSYYMNNNWIVMKARNAGGAPVVTRIQSQYGSPEAVNTPGVDPTSHGRTENMTLFANHATHEVGHAVGNRTLTHGGFNIKGDDWAQQYGHWQQNGSAEGYARTCGWTAALDGPNYTITDAAGTHTVTVTGTQIRQFLAGVAQGGPGSQASHVLATTFSGEAPAMFALQTNATVAGNGLFTTVFQLWRSLPGEGYHFPSGVTGPSVHFFCTRWGNRWVTYDAACFTSKVSNYSVSSYKEMFAELYTAKFTRGSLPPANNGQDPVAFFNALQQASPTELGLPAPAPASPGGGTGAAPSAQGAPGGAAGDQAQPKRDLSDAEIAAQLPGHPGTVFSA